MNIIISNKLVSVLDLAPLRDVYDRPLSLKPMGQEGDEQEISEETVKHEIIQRVGKADWITGRPASDPTPQAAEPTPLPEAPKDEAPAPLPEAPLPAPAPPEPAPSEPPAPLIPDPEPSKDEALVELPATPAEPESAPEPITPPPSRSSSKSRNK